MSTHRYLPVIPADYQPSVPEGSHEHHRKPDQRHSPPDDLEVLQHQRSRFMLGLFALSSFVMLITAAANLLPEDIRENMKEGVSAAATMLGILEDERLVWWAIIGAFCGAWVNVGIFRPTSTEEVIWKWVTSFFCSICFIPWIIESMGWDRTPTVALAASAAGAILGWSLIHALAPVATSIMATRLGSGLKVIFGVKDEDKKPKKPKL